MIYWFLIKQMEELSFTFVIEYSTSNFIELEMSKPIFICLLLIVLGQAKQLYMATVFRHGARYPLNNLYDGK